jgi:hypothetical protein
MMPIPTPIPPVDEAAGVLDELQAWYIAKAEAEGWVYTSVLRQLVNRMYRERDYLERRKAQGQRTAYDYAVDRDQKALAWAIRALVQCVPPEEKDKPEPPKKPKKPARRLSPSQRTVYKGRPSWNGMPKRDWDGPDLAPAPTPNPESVPSLTPSDLGWDAGTFVAFPVERQDGEDGPDRNTHAVIAEPAADADEHPAQDGNEAALARRDLDHGSPGAKEKGLREEPPLAEEAERGGAGEQSGQDERGGGAAP